MIKRRPQVSTLPNLVGNKYSRLTVQGYAGTDKFQKRIWNCLCECGTASVVVTAQLTTGKTRSCGCLAIEVRTKHGEIKKSGASPEYYVWRSMKNRCNHPKARYYKDYGARGIKVCERWAHSFEAFLQDMGRRPYPSASIDRINNDGNYEPSNCRWATKSEQTRNRRVTTYHEFNGRRQVLTDWCEELNIRYTTTYQRIRKGWSIERALTEPQPCKFMGRK